MSSDRFAEVLDADEIIPVRDAWEGLHLFQTRQRQLRKRGEAGDIMPSRRYQIMRAKIENQAARLIVKNKYKG